MMRYYLKPNFRNEPLKKAIEIEEGETYLGRKLSYMINYGFRMRQLQRGEVSLS